MAAYARCKVCPYRVELPVAIIVQDGPTLELEQSQRDELMRAVLAHIRNAHPAEYSQDERAKREFERLNG